MKAAADILVITPHPDDAELCAGGTLAGWIRRNLRVVLAACTSGDKGTSNPDLDPVRLAEIREEEQSAAAEVLGIREVVFMRYPDQGLEDTPDFRKEVVRLIRRYCPETLVTVDPYRRYIAHRDHRIVGQVCLDAAYPFARDRLAYPDLTAEGLMPHKVKELLFWFPEEANFYTDITDTFALKLAALQCHQSQIQEFGIRDIEGWLRQMGRNTAEGQPFELAEAFHRVEAPP